MAIKRNIENKIESAFITVIKSSPDIGNIPVRSWQDGSNGKVYPIILVNADTAFNDSVDSERTADLFQCVVNIAAMTYNYDDKDKSVVYNLAGLIRDVLSSKTLKENLSTASNNFSFLQVSVTAMDSQIDQENTNIILFTLDVRVQFITKIS